MRAGIRRDFATTQTDSPKTPQRMKAMTELTGMVGFASPITEQKFSRRRNLGVELLATVALAISLVIAATAVSIGMARAQTLRAPCFSAHAWMTKLVR
jgi:hypothetical protein